MMTSKRNEDIREIFSNWWWENLGNQNASQARARMARFKRAGLVEVLADAQTQALARKLGLGPGRAPDLARAVQALAFVRASGEHLPRGLGGKEPRMSSLRFERLIRSGPEEIGTAVRRALPLAGYACNPGRLGADLFYWNEQTRIRWVFDYYHAAAPQRPETSDQQTQTSDATEGAQ